MNPRRKPDIFISYSRKDDAPFQELMAVLSPLAKREEVEIFTDRGNLEAGDLFHRTIQAALREARLFVFLASPNSARSEYIRKHELPLAKERCGEEAMHALPVLLCDVPPADVWGWLWEVQFAARNSGPTDDDLPAIALDKAHGAARAERLAAIAADIMKAVRRAPARARPGASSEIVALRCDRDEQVELFGRNSEPRSLMPLAEVWLLPGNEDDLPGDLARRLYIEYVWSALQEQGAAAASQQTRFFRWPGPGANEARILTAFAHALARDEGTGRVTAAAAAELLRERAGYECLLGFHSEVDLRGEGGADLEQIRTFLAVLGTVVERFAGSGVAHPKVYVFLSVLMPPAGGLLSRLLGGGDARVLKDLAALAGGAGTCAARLAPKLGLVGKPHVKIWYKEEIANDDGGSVLFCDDVFGRAAALPMKDIIHRLKEEHAKTRRHQS